MNDAKSPKADQPKPSEPRPTPRPDPDPFGKPAPTFSYQAQDGGDLRFCQPWFKPPGAILDHETAKAGVWVYDERAAGWLKSGCPTRHKAHGVTEKAKTAAEALAAILAL